jgi:hypothetical protein
VPGSTWVMVPVSSIGSSLGTEATNLRDLYPAKTVEINN